MTLALLILTGATLGYSREMLGESLLLGPCSLDTWLLGRTIQDRTSCVECSPGFGYFYLSHSLWVSENDEFGLGWSISY